jgi:acetylcholinesterase
MTEKHSVFSHFKTLFKKGALYKEMKIFYFVSFVLALTASEIVEIDDGKIEGTKLQSRLDKTFLAFFKIPYAEPPIGDLRFRAPKPPVAWEGILNGTQPGPICFQKHPRDGSSEDCLHLNVFTKKLQQKKPVIVYIHGGGYEIGSGLDQGPHNLIDRDVVIVTINYRLGSFGFLAMGAEEAPGNSGMKDQVLALKWVKKNIRHFGGDENKVTIAGYSAGGFSVTAHLASKMSEGLFHRAIAMSGAITTSMPLNSNNLELAEKIGKNLNCEAENLLECLKKVRSKFHLMKSLKIH